MTGPDLLEGGAHRRGGPGRRRALTAAALAALAVAGAGAAPTVVSSLRAPTTEPAPTPSATSAALAPAQAAGPDCPASTFAGVDGATEYAVAFRAEIQDLQLFSGWHEQGQIWQSFAQGISATGCGLLRLPSLQAVIEEDDLVFDTEGVDIVTQTYDPQADVAVPLFQPGEVGIELRPTGPASNDVVGVRPADGHLLLDAVTPAELEVKNGPKNLSRFSCFAEPVTTLTTQRSAVRPEGRGPGGPVQPGRSDLPPWTLEGTPLSGPLVGARATVVGNDFPLPVFPATGSCSLFAELFNNVFAGSDAQGDTYRPDAEAYGPQHPAGVSQAIADLVITEIDEQAVQVGPPAVVPGTS